jgi:myo-inositol 2-dehydrogenase / D-chiro-inositol 1-dehydrogenase
MRQLVAGIIGAGRIGRMHAENIARFVDGITVKAISDPMMDDSLRDWGRGLSITDFFTDGLDIVEDPEIEAVLICSPSNTHVEYLQAAAAKSKYIFCEKPVDTEIGRIKIALDAVQEHKAFVQVGFNKRFDPHHRSVKSAIHDGAIGEIHLIKMVSRNFSPPPLEYVKSAGGLFVDSLIHEFDLARYISGKEIVSVLAAGGALVQKELEALGEIDTAVVTLIMEDGMMCVVDFSRQAKYGYDQRIEVLGSEGIVMDQNERPINRIVGTARGFHQELLHKGFVERFRDSYVAELRSFHSAITNGTEPEVTLFDGLIPIVAAEACKTALRERRMVQLEEIVADHGITWI